MSTYTIEGKNRNSKNTGKQSVVKDEDGYYQVNLGAVNTYNNSGVFYKMSNLQYHLSPESILGFRIQEGILKAEHDHPDFNNLNQRDLVERIALLHPDRICGHIRKIQFTNTGRTERGWEKYPIYTVSGWIKPEGPYGQYLEEYLSNPNENVALSVRTMVHESNIGNIRVRDILEFSTWDYVHENGVTGSTQWHSVGIENKSYVDGSLCLTDCCIPKLKSLTAGTEDNNPIDRMINSIKKNETITDKILGW